MCGLATGFGTLALLVHELDQAVVVCIRPGFAVAGKRVGFEPFGDEEFEAPVDDVSAHECREEEARVRLLFGPHPEDVLGEEGEGAGDPAFQSGCRELADVDGGEGDPRQVAVESRESPTQPAGDQVHPTVEHRVDLSESRPVRAAAE